MSEENNEGLRIVDFLRGLDISSASAARVIVILITLFGTKNAVAEVFNFDGDKPQIPSGSPIPANFEPCDFREAVVPADPPTVKIQGRHAFPKPQKKGGRTNKAFDKNFKGPWFA